MPVNCLNPGVDRRGGGGIECQASHLPTHCQELRSEEVAPDGGPRRSFCMIGGSCGGHSLPRSAILNTTCA